MERRKAMAAAAGIAVSTAAGAVALMTNLALAQDHAAKGPGTFAPSAVVAADPFASPRAHGRLPAGAHPGTTAGAPAGSPVTAPGPAAAASTGATAVRGLATAKVPSPRAPHPAASQDGSRTDASEPVQGPSREPSQNPAPSSTSAGPPAAPSSPRPSYVHESERPDPSQSPEPNDD